MFVAPLAEVLLAGLGISVQYTTVPPIGKNTVRGNDDPAECSPVFIC